MIGRKILNYEIKKLLGEGGMGNVYLAEHTQLGRKVAVKSLHPQLVKNEGLRARFKKEASTMAHLQHPKIVTLYDYVEEEDGLFLIMEFVEGLPLDEYIREKSGPIPSEIAIPMMMQILDAFSYAHSKGIVHRDIKPSNIIISDRDEIKILDFGIAKLLSEAGNKLTKTGTQMGTVFYMSPEQVQGKDIDIRSDIYSLGVTFYQMLTGISPYDGMTTEFEVYSKIVSEPLPNASSLYPGVPEFLDKVILKATAKNKADRFQSCEEFSGYLSKRETPITESKTVVQTNNPLQNQVPRVRVIPLIVFIAIVVIVGLIIKGRFNNSNSSDKVPGADTPVEPAAPAAPKVPLKPEEPEFPPAAAPVVPPVGPPAKQPDKPGSDGTFVEKEINIQAISLESLREKIKSSTKGKRVDLKSIKLDLGNYSLNYLIGDDLVNGISLIYDPNKVNLDNRIVHDVAPKNTEFEMVILIESKYSTRDNMYCALIAFKKPE